MIYKKTHSGLNGLKIEIYSFDLKGKLLPFRISCIMLILENLKEYTNSFSITLKQKLTR